MSNTEARERNRSEQNQSQTDRNQSSNVAPITQHTSHANNSSQEVTLQGEGQQGLANGQMSPVVQGQSSTIEQTNDKQGSEGQTVELKGQERVDSTVVQSLPVETKQEDIQQSHIGQGSSDIGQRSSTHPDHPDNLQELLNQVPAGLGPKELTLPQENVLPSVQVQQGVTVRDPSPLREGGHVRTNLSAAPRFSIQGSEEDESSPPTPKGKFFI